MTDSLAKPLMFPDAKKLTDLFSKWSYKKEEVRALSFPHKDLFARGRSRTFQVPIGPYCSVDGPSGHYGVYVEPRPDLIEKLRENFIGSAHDSLYFEIVIREDGALVIAKNNQIIASRWLALLPLSEVPTPPKVTWKDEGVAGPVWVDGKPYATDESVETLDGKPGTKWFTKEQARQIAEKLGAMFEEM